MDEPTLRRLLEHLAWADAEVERSLAEAGERAPADALELHAHVLGAELVWLDRLEGRPQGTAVWPAADLAGCRALARTARKRFAALVDRLSAGDLAAALARPVAYVNSAGQGFETSVLDILLHVVLHGAYHRGQVARALREAGAAAAPTDYVAFVRGAPAATRADAERSGRG